MRQHPTLIEMMRHLIGSPSSAASAEWDKSNAQVIDHLAGWCESSPGSRRTSADRRPSGKFNLVASAGTGPEGLPVLSGSPTPCLTTRRAGAAILPASPNAKTDGLWPGTCDMKGFFAVALEAISDPDLSVSQTSADPGGRRRGKQHAVPKHWSTPTQMGGMR